MTFMACAGFIVWAHSRDTKILGVQPGPAIQGSLAAKQATAGKTARQLIREQYFKEFVSATALTVVDNAPPSYLVTFRRNKYFSRKADSLLLRFRPQQVLHQ